MEALPFSSLRPGAALPDWLKPYAFDNQPRHTRYALVEDAGRTVLHARADASTSGLTRAIRVDPAAHPVLAWRWKVKNLIAKSDLATHDGDDFPARLYVSFDVDVASLSFGDRMSIGLARMLYGPQVPVAVLCYVWDNKAPAGTIVPNAYTDRVRMIVAESGAARVGRWVEYERDVAQDFIRAFGPARTVPAGGTGGAREAAPVPGSPPIPMINGIIVSTDTDNTGESAEAWFGDVAFRARRPS